MASISFNGQAVFGINIQAQTQCVHYHSPRDIIAIKFKCCQKYYCCFYCHQEMAKNYDAQQWQCHEFDIMALLCGKCAH